MGDRSYAVEGWAAYTLVKEGEGGKWTAGGLSGDLQPALVDECCCLRMERGVEGG